MNAIDITFSRALKVWWSYIWRVFVLLVPVMIVAMVLVFSIIPFPKPGQPGVAFRPDQIPGLMGRMTLVWFFMMALNILAQVQALKWMLKTRWSDFRLLPVPIEPGPP